MNNQPDNTDNDPPREGDELSLWVAGQLSSLMSEHGIPSRQQATFLNEVCGLSLSQARRKLRGSVWSFDEVLAITRRFGASMDQLFAAPPNAGVSYTPKAPGAFIAPSQAATFIMDGCAVPCHVRLGALAPATVDKDQLLTALNRDGWQVGTKNSLAGMQGPCYLAEQVLLMPTPGKPPVRIAILDDDAGTTETLCEWFNAAGYLATPYLSAEQFLSSDIQSQEAFVVDYLLSGGDTSQEVIRTIQQRQPDAPIVLLTGKLRDGQVSEADLSTLLRTSRVTFFEKPVRPSVLAATIDKELDLIAQRAD